MDNKYYTPKLSDFYPGYEYEQYAPGTGDEYRKMVFGPTIEEARFIKPVYQQGYESGWFRTAYLTREQIEAEGWKYTGRSIDMWFEMRGDFEQSSWTAYKAVMQYGVDHRLRIYLEDFGTEQVIFIGECKSINEFKTIQSWLKIK